MAQTIFGAEYAVSVLNRAFNNTSPSNAVFTNQVSTAGATEASQHAFAANFAKGFLNVSDAALATQVLTNLGVLPSDVAEVQALEGALADFFGTVSKEDRGIVVLQLGTILSGLETAEGELAAYAPAAALWNREVERAYVYSSNPVHTTPQEGDDAISSTTLTRYTDVLSGSQFQGYLDYNQFTGKDEQTLTNGDRLTGTSGDSDILYAQLQNNTTRPTLTGIETLSIDAKADDVGLDLSDVTGAKTVVNQSSVEVAELAFLNANSKVDLVVQNTKADTYLSFAPTVLAGATEINVTLNGAGAAADRVNLHIGGSGDTRVAGPINGVESLNINATGAASLVTLVDSTAVTKVTITGDQNLSVGTKTADGFNSAALTTVDASAATGNLFLNVAAAGAKNQTITTGTGNDTIVVSGLNENDKINAGEGLDRVVLTDAGSAAAATLTGVEQVEARTIDTLLNLIGSPNVNLIALAAVGKAASLASIKNATGVAVGTTFAYEGSGNITAGVATEFGTIDFNLAKAGGKNDVVNFTYSNGGTQLGTDNTVDIGAITNTGNNAETFNFTFSDVGTDDVVTLDDIVSANLTTLNITSGSQVVITNALAMAKLTNVDASGVEGGITADLGTLGLAADVSVKLGGSGTNVVTVIKDDFQDPVTATHGNTTLTLDASAATGTQVLEVENKDTNDAADKFDAEDAAFTGSAGVAIVGGSAGDTIKVTSYDYGITTIEGGAGGDTIDLTASAGQDVLVLRHGATGANVGTADLVDGFTSVQVPSGNAADDKIDLSEFGFDTTVQTVLAKAAALTGAAGEFGTSAVAIYDNGANTTVYVDTNGNGKLGAGDLVIVLVGLTDGGGAGSHAIQGGVGQDIIWG